MSGAYLIVASIANFALMAADKFISEDYRKSAEQVKHRVVRNANFCMLYRTLWPLFQEWRVPENWFFIGATIGGWPGGVFAMVLLRHKTAKRTFLVQYAVSALVHLFLLYEFELESVHFGKLL